MRNGAQVVLLDGDEALEVVGESYYQDNLWQLAGARPGKERVREDIYAVLVAEDDNPYDPNAVAVWISGLKVGHLSRENAQLYRPGLLAQQEALGRPVALAGVITGGGIRSDGPGKLGVFLQHDPEDFGLRRHPLPPLPESRECAPVCRMRSRLTRPMIPTIWPG
jgi:HIRAN domain